LTWSGSPTLDRSLQRIPSKSLNQDHDDAGSEEGFGDDFDDFEEGAQIGEVDDFGDFDESFERPSAAEEASEPRYLPQDEQPPTFVSRQCSNSSNFILARGSFSFPLMLIS
jgi:Domain of unknown function (DUF5102)